MNWFQSFSSFIAESNITKDKLDQIEMYADNLFSPEDIEFSYHFFQQLSNPRNEPAISDAELIGFFKRLYKNKKGLEYFLKKYDEIVVSDQRNKINVPFVKKIDSILAKTIMRKKDFKTSNPKLRI